ncbi:hypothetical protein Tco_0277077 [Tanacetum coccineum]
MSRNGGGQKSAWLLEIRSDLSVRYDEYFGMRTLTRFYQSPPLAPSHWVVTLTEVLSDRSRWHHSHIVLRKPQGPMTWVWVELQSETSSSSLSFQNKEVELLRIQD